MVDVIDALKNIINMSDTSAIIKIVLTIVLIAAYLFWSIRGKSIEIKASRKEEAKDKQENHDDVVVQNKKENDELQSDSKRADDFLKRR